MWWFALIFFANAVLPHNSVVYEYRVSVGGFPVNILDALVFFGVGLSLLPIWRRALPAARSHPVWARGLMLLMAAGIVGVFQSYLFYPDLPPRFRLPPMRNFFLVPACMYASYQVITRPQQAKTVFWVIFLSSLGSAVASVVTGGSQTFTIAETSGSAFDSLRMTALDVGGDAGLLAACVLLFSLVSGLRFLPLLFAWLLVAVAAMGMFFIPHRSTWLINFITCWFAAFILWPTDRGRKWLIGTVTVLSLLVVGAAMTAVVESTTGKDFSAWVTQRLESLLPSDDGTHAKAWDTRLPGAQRELSLWLDNPLLGRGFAAQEGASFEDGFWVSYRHTPWISTLLETGPLGVAGFAVVIGSLVIAGTRMARTGPDLWFALVGAMGASWGVACVWMGAFTLSWNSPRLAIALGLLAGAFFRLREFAIALEEQPLIGDEPHELDPAAWGAALE